MFEKNCPTCRWYRYKGGRLGRLRSKQCSRTVDGFLCKMFYYQHWEPSEQYKEEYKKK